MVARFGFITFCARKRRLILIDTQRFATSTVKIMMLDGAGGVRKLRERPNGRGENSILMLWMDLVPLLAGVTIGRTVEQVC